ncbi:hypothetical protein [uncultured Polaribacter sp.]|uniref:hypothetical protein n=1 Tax=uncultured Polaribacter sp. TaxID=174711 RepID=UPI002630DED0|nr:hypothetical protein [uncultured Polaribacter sp.]
MQTEKKETYTLITNKQKTFSEFYDAFLIEEKKLQKENIILHFSNESDVSSKEFLLFLDIAKQKKENGTSFVIVNSKIDIDNFPESFNITPTLQEAEDIIEMEAIERELGF